MTSAVAATLVVSTAVAATATAVAATAAATLPGDDIDECLYLLLGSIVHAQHLTFEHETHAGIGVVEVNGHSLILHLHHETVHALAVGIHEGDYVARINLLVIKLAIHAEDLLVHVEYEVLAAVTIGLIFGKGEVKGVALLQVLELLLESLEGEAQTCGELERLLCSCLLYEFLHAFILCIHVVRHDNRLAGIDFCHSFIGSIIVRATKVV